MEGILLLWIYESKCILQWIPGGIICPLTLFNLYYWHIQGCLTPTRRKKNQSTLIFKNVSLPAFWKWKWMFFEKLPEFCFKPPGSCTSGNNFESKKFINKKICWCINTNPSLCLFLGGRKHSLHPAGGSLGGSCRSFLCRQDRRTFCRGYSNMETAPKQLHQPSLPHQTPSS